MSHFTMVAVDSIQERFVNFDAQHPEIYCEFKRRALQLWNAGRMHYGAKSIMEAVRFHSAVSGKDIEPFKINNNYISRYARKLIDEDGRFCDFFELRELRTE